MTNNQKIAYLQGLTTGCPNDAIEGFKCNGDLFHRAMDELRQRFGQPTLIVNGFIGKLINQTFPNCL